jgi:hypothetical protein
MATSPTRSGISGQTCEHLSILAGAYQGGVDEECYSDVSRISNVSVSAYLRTAQCLKGQDDMGNDLLIARVDITPSLDGQVSLLTR